MMAPIRLSVADIVLAGRPHVPGSTREFDTRPAKCRHYKAPSVLNLHPFPHD
ncbi:hypothetical protein SKAU_G00293460 [Synaphobranchus kaupii]|uniref:Uncharacterized protein n=1 Tax=Synaphobranchus kaupii TaxID=118154 RepID=A0A9Q1EUA5_SYNKA|nr:hypothetical protein SKAU_G00293460 [Synaphobranchus kaupii]